MTAPAPDCPLCHSARAGQRTRVSKKAYWRCEVCELVYLDPAHYLDPAEEKARYELHENDPTDKGYRDFLRGLIRHLVPNLEDGASGLDYGAGPAPAMAQMLEAKGYRMTTFDPYFTSDTDTLEGSYDFITCTETAEHFHDPAREFRRFSRLLRPGGWIGLMTRRLERLEDLPVDFDDWHYRRDETHVCFYSRPTMEWIADRFGWQAEYPRYDVTLFH